MENEHERQSRLLETASFKKNAESGDSYKKNYIGKSKSISVGKFEYSDKKGDSSSSKKNSNKKGLKIENVRKKSINTIKNSLYEALKNINKELNVKIDKGERNRVSLSVMNFIDKNPQDINDIYNEDNELNSSNDNSEEVNRVVKKEDGFARKMSKKVDLETVLGNFKQPKLDQYLNPPKDNNNNTIDNDDEIGLNIEKQNNLKFEMINKKISPFISRPSFSSEIIKDEDHKKVFESLTKSNILSVKYINKKDALLVINQAELPNLLNLFKLKDEELLSKSQKIEQLNREIQSLRSEVESKSKIINFYMTKKEESELEYKNTITESENNLKSALNHSVKMEKENNVLKIELENSKKYKHSLITKFNEDLNDIGLLSQEFIEKFISTEEDVLNNINEEQVEEDNVTDVNNIGEEY